MKTGTFTRCRNHSVWNHGCGEVHVSSAEEIAFLQLTVSIHGRHSQASGHWTAEEVLQPRGGGGTTCRRSSVVKLPHPLLSPQVLRCYVTRVEADIPRLWACTAPHIQYTDNSGILYIHTYIKIYTHALHDLPCAFHTYTGTASINPEVFD